MSRREYGGDTSAKGMANEDETPSAEVLQGSGQECRIVARATSDRWER